MDVGMEGGIGVMQHKPGGVGRQQDPEEGGSGICPRGCVLSHPTCGKGYKSLKDTNTPVKPWVLSDVMVEGEASSLPTLVVWSTTCGRVLGKLLILWFPCSCSVSGMAGSATLARVTVSPPCRGSLGAKPFPGSSISQHLP